MRRTRGYPSPNPRPSLNPSPNPDPNPNPNPKPNPEQALGAATEPDAIAAMEAKLTADVAALVAQ